MSGIITNEHERVVRLFGSLDRMLSGIERLVAGHRPTLGGERFLTDKEVSRRLKISRRTLQDWRTNGQIAYIALGGKVLYKESEIQKMLEKYHRKAWQ
ncbi:helix-turn-helix domain-containing protein [Culturomica sp.]|uniref:helix-turn-helix domain-containing protein n=1 Tax=Culturomica sp. TaxID=1926652 RepID=UPI000E934962|nr:helix-turn-helix domain-containing protein [Culturomica sp.]HBO26281.1 DNA-binding protein [Culturomica sp.]